MVSEVGNVIEIQFSEDHSSDLQNEMRDRMVMGVWRQQWYKAQREENWDEMIRLDEKMELITFEGLL